MTHLRYLPYLLLSVLIVGPLLAPGFVLTMDMVFTPELRLPGHMDNTWLLYAGLHVLGAVVPADVVQKLILLGIFVLSGVGMHRLLLRAGPGGAHWRWAAYAGGVLYTVNPFVYDRLMAGQWGVLLGYSLLPWFVASLLAWLRAPGWATSLRLTGWVVAMSVVSIHSLGYAAVVGLVALVVLARDKPQIKQLLRWGALSAAVFVLASSYWLVPTLLGQGRIASSLQTFTPTGQAAFATVDAIGTGQLGAVLGLLGFWQETRGLYVQPIESYALWGFVYVAIIALVAIGFWQAWKRQRGLAVAALAVSLVATLLAVWGGGLLAHVPLLSGYREPHKFVALLALAYAYALTMGVAWLMERFGRRKWLMHVVWAMAVALPLAYTPTLLWGAQGQLSAVSYPPDWFRAREQLEDVGKVLVLPWHLYMSYEFTGQRIIASPAKGFFGARAVISDNPELPGVAPQTRDPTREAVERNILPAAARGQDVSAQLASLGIGYVLLLKELDWSGYRQLPEQPGFSLLYEGDTLRLYRVAK